MSDDYKRSMSLYEKITDLSEGFSNQDVACALAYSLASLAMDSPDPNYTLGEFFDMSRSALDVLQEEDDNEEVPSL